MMVRTNLDIAVRMVFMSSEGKSVVLDVTEGEGHTFMLIAVYAPMEAGRADFFRGLETVQRTSCSLVLVRDWDGVLDM